MIHIGMNRNLLARTEIEFRYQILLGLPALPSRYLQYVGSSDQERMESLPALKAETRYGVCRAAA